MPATDEVGTGDYFGSRLRLCLRRQPAGSAVALQELKVNDSKQINDEVILQTAPLFNGTAGVFGADPAAG